MKSETSNKKQEKRPKYNFPQNCAYMIHEAWTVRKSVLILCVLMALLAVANNLAQLFIAPVILKKVETAVPLPELLSTILLFSGIIILLSALRVYVSQNTLFGRVEIRLDLVLKVSRKTAITSFPNTEDTSVLMMQDRAAMALSNNDSATEAIWTTLTELLQNISGLIVYLLLMSSLDPILIVVILITTIVGYFVDKPIYEWGYRHRGEEAGYSKRMNYISQRAKETSLAKDIRIFGMRQWLEDVHKSTMRLYDAFITRREKVYIWANVTDVILTFLRNGFAYFYLIYLTLKEGLPASSFLLYFTAVDGFTSWIINILSSVSTIQRQSHDLSIVREYLEFPEPFLFEEGKPLRADSQTSYELQLKNVSFRYPDAAKDTLHHLNLTIRSGEKLAIVGLNGAGKTTLVKLICGFYDPTEGEVLLNGVNIKEYNRHDYYSMFSAVFQQFSLLEATLAENVAQSVEQIDEAKVADCIHKAGLSDKVLNLPQQYQTYIGRLVFEDGIELSGGETQRLMLARALYKDAPIIVLDEPTAALDPISENEIYLKYHEMTAGRTSFYISHRLASTRFCDRIIFLSDGSIAEEGNHESLMAQGGKYAELFHVQSKYYQQSVRQNTSEQTLTQ